MKFSYPLALALSLVLCGFIAELHAQVDAGEDVEFLCFEDSVQLQASPGFQNYSWTPTEFLSDPNIANPIAGPFPVGTTSQTYSLTATDADNVESTDEVNIMIGINVPTNAGFDTLICSGEPVILGSLPVSPEGSTFLWSPNENIDDVTAENPTVNPTQTTSYSVMSQNSLCSGSDVVTVIVEEVPAINFEYHAIPTCTGLEIQFENKGASFLDYEWEFGDGSFSESYSPSNIYTYNTAYLVRLNGTSDLGCIYTSLDVIEVTDFASYVDIVTPNVITPNLDGKNDNLDINISGRVGDCLQMQVFNRFGQVVFESTGNNTRWDGRTIAGELVNQGVYYYYVEFNGTSYKGSVQVLY
jgi:gliding motility-associated-like protein